MRRPRDYDAEMKLLADKAKALQDRKLRELGQLVTATGADGLGVDVLAGVLVRAATTTDMVQREEWRTAGATFFLRGKLATSAAKDDLPHYAGPPDKREFRRLWSPWWADRSGA